MSVLVPSHTMMESQAAIPSSSSVTGLLALLRDVDNRIQIFALQHLLDCVEVHWPEISDSLTEIEQLYEDEKFPERCLAALVTSMVYFHLEEYTEAVRYGLRAGSRLDLSNPTPYVQTITTKCITEYVSLRQQVYENQQKNEDSGEGEDSFMNEQRIIIDPELEALVERMLNHSLTVTRRPKEALGVAFESRRLDKVEATLRSICPSSLSGMLEYCLLNSPLITSKKFRQEVLSLLIRLYNGLDAESSAKELPRLCQCLFNIGDVDRVAQILRDLLFLGDETNNDLNVLKAYQIAFDLVQLEDQAILHQLLNHELMQLPSSSSTAEKEEAEASGKDEEKETKGEETSPEKIDGKETSEPEGSEEHVKLKRLRYILSGEAAIDLELLFLHRNNHSDLQLLEQMKNSVDPRNSITHNALVLSHSLMQAGTTCDAFLRPNLEWLSRAVCWAKFSTTAALGVIHKGHIHQSRKVLSTTLPGGEGSGGPYAESGSLYALGLIHANHGDEEVMEYLLTQLRNAQNSEVIQHGACLGLGLLCMGSSDENLYSELKSVLFMDSAIAGEAASIAIGLVMLGSGSSKVITEMLAYAHDTQHEKITRACALAIAFVLYRREEEADAFIEEMTANKDALIRYGAMLSIGMAYCGTSASCAVRRLLHTSALDVSDDVRRSAVISLAFVLCNNPDSIPRVVKLLSDSFNPHVRYGSALAVGLCCAGTAKEAAVNMLMPMTQDTTDFVRQAALLSLGLLLMEVTDVELPTTLTQVRQLFQRVAADKHEDVMSRLGAILGQGLLDAGGRNMLASLYSSSGHLRRQAVVGFLLFSQLWYWLPLIPCVSLAFQTTALIGITKELKMPVSFKVACAPPVPRLFDYPQPTTKEKLEVKKETVTAVLSTTAKKNAQNRKKLNKLTSKLDSLGEDVLMDLDGTLKEENGDQNLIKDNSDGQPMEDGKGDEDKKSSTKVTYLKNPFRVLPQQLNHLHYVQTSRYRPVYPERKAGFVMLYDTSPESPEEYVNAPDAPIVKETSKEAESPAGVEEPPPPSDFEWAG